MSANVSRKYRRARTTAHALMSKNDTWALFLYPASRLAVVARHLSAPCDTPSPAHRKVRTTQQRHRHNMTRYNRPSMAAPGRASVEYSRGLMSLSHGELPCSSRSTRWRSPSSYTRLKSSQTTVLPGRAAGNSPRSRSRACVSANAAGAGRLRFRAAIVHEAVTSQASC